MSYVVFTPRANKTAAQNLNDFIEHCRCKLDVFNSRAQFTESIWDVSDFFRDGRNHNFRFFAYEQPSSDGIAALSINTPISEPLCSLLKANIIYEHSAKPQSYAPIEGKLRAVKCLEFVLRNTKQDYELGDLNGDILMKTLTFAETQFEYSTIYGMGKILERFIKFLAKKALIPRKIPWSSPLKKPVFKIELSGKSGDIARAKLLPSKTAITALAKLFHVCHADPQSEDYFRMLTSVCAIMMCSPSRINELLLQHREIEVTHFSTHMGQYGLRWWPEKGGAPIVKPVHDEFVDTAKRAISSITELTAEARKIAQWYENNPGSIYFHNDVSHLSGKELLTQREIGQILFGLDCSKSAGKVWLKNNDIESTGIDTTNKLGTMFYRAADVAEAIQRYLPSGFPYFDESLKIKYSDMMFLIVGDSLRTGNTINRCIVQLFNYNKLTSGLTKKNASKTIFEAYGYTEEDGSPIQVATHQFRHWLNTLMNASGKLSQEDIAILSGRKDIQQNTAYNHLTSQQRVEQLRNLIGNGDRATGRFALSPVVIPITKEQYAAKRVPAAHVSDFGVCFHNFAQEPCQLHRDCLMCNDHICVKGDDEAKQRLEFKLNETRYFLEASRKLADVEWGADAWVQHNLELVERMDALVSALNDPTIAHGAIIHLANKDAPSRLKTALEQRVEIDLYQLADIPKEALINAQYIEEIAAADAN